MFFGNSVLRRGGTPRCAVRGRLVICPGQDKGAWAATHARTNDYEGEMPVVIGEGHCARISFHGARTLNSIVLGDWIEKNGISLTERCVSPDGKLTMNLPSLPK